MKKGNALTAAEIIAQLLIQIPQRYPEVRVWRRNVGKGIGFDSVRHAIGHIQRGSIEMGLSMLQRPITFGMPGEPDIEGILDDGRWLGVEVKAAGDKMREAQINFAAMIRSRGGVCLEARGVEETLQDLAAYAMTAEDLKKAGRAMQQDMFLGAND